MHATERVLLLTREYYSAAKVLTHGKTHLLPVKAIVIRREGHFYELTWVEVELSYERLWADPVKANRGGDAGAGGD